MHQLGQGTQRTDTSQWKLRVTRGAAHFRADLSFAIIDAFLISMAYLAALELRFIDTTGVPIEYFSSLMKVLPIAILVHIVFSVALGTYGHVWEYASIAEAKQIAIASMLSTATNLALLLAARSLLSIEGPVPISTVVLGGLLSLFGMGFVRFRSRLFSFRRQYGIEGPDRTVVIGTGRAAAEFARFAPHAASPTEVVGFVSVDSEREFSMPSTPRSRAPSARNSSPSWCHSSPSMKVADQTSAWYRRSTNGPANITSLAIWSKPDVSPRCGMSRADEARSPVSYT